MALPAANNSHKITGTNIEAKTQYEATFSPHGTSTTEIVYQKDTSIHIVDRKNTYRRTIIWPHDQIQDMCYSKKLEKFILITSTKCFTLDTKIVDKTEVEEVLPIRPMDENSHYQSCACYDSVLFLTYSEEGYPIEQREIVSSGDNLWRIIKHWKAMLKPNDICKCVRFLQLDKIGLIISNSTARTSRLSVLSLQSGRLSEEYNLNGQSNYNRFFIIAVGEYIFIPDDHTHVFLVAPKDMMYRTFAWPVPPFVGGFQIQFNGWWPYNIPE